WVVNGQRLKRDTSQFFEVLRHSAILRVNSLTLSVPVCTCMLLRKWADSRVPVFSDFDEVEDPSGRVRFGAPVLWALHPRSSNGRAFLIPVYRENFVKAAINGTQLKGIDCSEAIERARKALLVVHGEPHYLKPRLRGSEQFTPRTYRARR